MILWTSLKTAEQFAAVMQSSRRRKSTVPSYLPGEHLALHLALDASSHPALVSQAREAKILIGVICPKRLAKAAVRRNVIKRQTYAACAQYAQQLPAGAYVLRLNATFAKEQFKSASSQALKRQVRIELDAIFSRLIDQVARSSAQALQT